MALTSGERAALWRKRQKEDPERHAKYKEKERQRYKKRREEGSLKSINEMNEREKRKTRRNWRKNQSSKRQRDNMIIKHVQQQLSPPTSPNTDNPENIPPKKRGRKRTRKENSKAYRDLFQLRVRFDCERRLKEKYKKRAYRLSKNYTEKTDIDKEVDIKLKSKDIRKALTLHLIMIRNIKEMKDQVNKKDKKVIREIVSRDKILKKYKLGKYAQKVLSMKVTQNTKRQTKEKRWSLIKTLVVDFIQRDDNSRIMGGKKFTVTRHGNKKQIRLLNDSMKNLHEKFLSEHTSKISYSLFCKLKPFYVIKPTEKHRETCLCKHHENIQFKINKIFQEKAIETNNIDALLKEITCSIESKACMYRECANCRTKSLSFKNADGRQVFWYSWKNVRFEKEKRNENGTVEIRKIVKMMKQKEYGTLENLTFDMQNDLKRVGRHVYNIRHQYRSIRKLRETLGDKDVIVHIDFSENYSCKCTSEIQGMHFGASQRQITLHTGMVYYKDSSQSFTTLSDSMFHGPAAIWAHMKPVLNKIVQQKNVERVHFVSD
jgi:hypothetical protein